MNTVAVALINSRVVDLLRVAALGLVAALGGIGQAQPVPHVGVPGGQEWLAGDFAGAYHLATEVDTVAAQLLAARAAADQAVFREPDPDAAKTWLGLAETAAARVLELDPDGPLAAAANLALARAKGEAALYRGALSNANLPLELKALIERALALEPDSPDALVALGAWHLELTARGVGWLYGGDRTQVLPLMARGVGGAPEQLNLRVEYARALMATGREEAAQEQLELALELPVETAADEFERARARELLAQP